MKSNRYFFFQSAAEYARSQGDPFFILSVNGMMQETGQGMFMSATVRDLTFDGVKSPLIGKSNF